MYTSQVNQKTWLDAKWVNEVLTLINVNWRDNLIKWWITEWIDWLIYSPKCYNFDRYALVAKDRRNGGASSSWFAASLDKLCTMGNIRLGLDSVT